MSEGWPDFWLKGKYIELIDLINTVNLIKTIQTIQQIDNITTLDTIDTINKINLIKAIYNAEMKNVGITNGDFETGDLTGWYTKYTGAEHGTVTVTNEKPFHGNYSCKITVATPMPTSTPEINQLMMIPTELVERLELEWNGEPNTTFWVGFFYTDGTSDDFYMENTALFARWLHMTITNSQLSAGKVIERIGMGPAVTDTDNEGKTFYVDTVNLVLRTLVYQAEKDRTITNWPTEYPLPSAQVADLKTVQVEDITKVCSPVSFDVSATAAGNTAIWTPTAGKAIRLKLVQYESDADVEVGLRFGDTGPLFARRVTAGAMALNLIGCNIQGGTDEALYLYAGGAVNVKGFVLGEEV
jgi:hypothetical protein